jgi:hypothetical protein
MAEPPPPSIGSVVACAGGAIINAMTAARRSFVIVRTPFLAGWERPDPCAEESYFLHLLYYLVPPHFGKEILMVGDVTY